MGAIAGVAVLVAVVVAALLLSGGDAESGAAPATSSLALVEGIEQDGWFLGDPDAPVLLVEYADFQCPFCGQFANATLPELIRDYVRPGRVRLELRGLAFLGQDSVTALRHALAAGEQDRLWHVAELLFENQGQENAGWVTDDLLTGIGAAVPGLDADAWRAAADSAAVEEQLQDAQRLATGQNVGGTPTFFVGRTGEELEPLNVASLEASSFRPTFDELLSE